MASISEFLTDDHRRCDELFVRLEGCASRADWASGEVALAAFAGALEAHLRMEEEVLFPCIEVRAGAVAGPTAVMRAEHGRLRELLAGLAAAVRARATERVLGLCETLHLMGQQHNLKEEQILYPAAERALGAEASGVLARLRAVHGP